MGLFDSKDAINTIAEDICFPFLFYPIPGFDVTKRIHPLSGQNN